VGFNPGTRSGETGHHYAGRNNSFWRLLHESGLAGAQFGPAEDRLLLGYGYGLTNIVARTTPSSSDLRRDDYRQGAAELGRKIEDGRPRVVAYMGKGVYAALRGMAGSTGVAYGLQDQSVSRGSLDFVLASPSGRATIPYRDKLALTTELAELVRQVEAQAAREQERLLAANLIDGVLGVAAGDRLLILSGRPPSEVVGPLSRRAAEVGAVAVVSPRMREGPLDPNAYDYDAVVLAPSPRDWLDPQVQGLLRQVASRRREGGPRTALLPPAAEECLRRALSYDEHAVSGSCAELAALIDEAREVRVSSDEGTDLSVKVRGSGAGPIGALPGAVFLEVEEGTAHGTLVVDGSTHDGLLSERLTLRLAEGRVVHLQRSGRPAGMDAGPDPLVDRLFAQVELRAARDPDALALRQLAIGRNPTSRLSGCLLEDQTVAGACYAGFGRAVAGGLGYCLWGGVSMHSDIRAVAR